MKRYFSTLDYILLINMWKGCCLVQTQIHFLFYTAAVKANKTDLYVTDQYLIVSVHFLLNTGADEKEVTTAV